MNVRIVLVGGWEFMKDDGIDEEISKLAGGKMLLIPEASKFPEKQVNRAIEIYKKYKTDVLLLEKDSQTIPEDIKVVYISGGQPEKLMEYFQNHQDFLKDIKNKWLKRKIIICGSSTGAMVPFKEMLAEDSRGRGNTNLIPALNFIKNNVVAIPHWNEQNGSQEWRDKFVENHKEKLLIAIDEYTSLFWGDSEAKVIGLGTVNIIINKNMERYENNQVINNIHLLTENEK